MPEAGNTKPEGITLHDVTVVPTEILATLDTKVKYNRLAAVGPRTAKKGHSQAK